jgi:hypothetical protein
MSEHANESAVVENQILCKPVSVMGDIVNTLGIYVCQAGNPSSDSLYFMPRYSLNQNKEFLQNLYPTYFQENNEITGKGICCFLYKVEKIYRGISTTEYLNNAELKANPHHLVAYQAWCNLNRIGEENRSPTEDIYILSPICKFPQPKFTPGQNNSYSSYYTLEEILTCGQELPTKGEK